MNAALIMAILLAAAGAVQGGAPVAPRPAASGPVLLRAPQHCVPYPNREEDGAFDFSQCFNGGDYPLAAWEAREQGVTGVRVTFGADYQPSGCEITASSGSAALDRASCDLLRERLFSSSYPVIAGEVRWVLPDGPPHDDRPSLLTYFSTYDYPAAALRGEEQGTTAVNLEIGANGRVTDCVVTFTSGSAALDQATCRIIRSRARYRPAQDAAGQAVPSRDTAVVAWRLPRD